MKKLTMILAALLVCGVVARATQDTTIDERDVRNPKKLKTWLEANATDAESRLVSNATNSNQLILTTTTDAGTASITMQADKADDAGDKFGIVATDGSGLAIQSDASVKGTLATKVTVSSAGGIAAADAITLTDADGNAAISAIGYEAGTASLILDADQGDDNADTVTLTAADGGTLSFYNHTTEVGSLTSGGNLAVDGSVACGDAITLTDADGASAISSIGYEASAATLILDADQGDDNADTVTFSVADGGVLSILNHTTEIATLSTAGALAVDAGVAAGDAVTLTDADGNATVSAIAASGAYHAELVLDADAGEDNADTWTIRAQDDNSNALAVHNHTTELLTLSTAGALAIDAGLTLGDAVTMTDADGAAVATLTGYEANEASLVLSSDQDDDAGDKMAWTTVADGGGLAFQSDFDSKGTLATKFTVGTTGVVTMKGGALLDNTTSADVLNLTETTVQITGAFAASADATITGGDITGAGGNSIDISEATDNAITLVRHDAGAFTLTCKDDDANADLTVVAGGTGDVTVGDVTDSAVIIPLQAVVSETTTNRVCTSADYGKLVIINTNNVVAVTLPANGAPAGAYIEFAVHGAASDDCAPTISAATADSLIGPNDVDLDSVTWGSSHRIGAQAKFWSDGSYWHVQNLGGTTMTYTD